MKILMITTYFAPDTAIAAVRPSAISKELCKMGNTVIVLRSGEIHRSIDETYDVEKLGIKIVSYLGDESTIELFKKGQIKKETVKPARSRLYFFPIKLRVPIANLYHKILRPIEYKKECRIIKENLNKQIQSISEFSHNEFDVIWCTYGRPENIYAGIFAKKYFNCPLVIDLRDYVVHDRNSLFVTKKQAKEERLFISNADLVVTVSENYTKDLIKKYQDIKNKKIVTIHNGYENVDYSEKPIRKTSSDLILCYTGSLYSGKLNLSPLFRAIKEMKDTNRIDLDRIKFFYAGPEFEYLKLQASKYDVSCILQNCGYLDKQQVYDLQINSDIFVVAARNFKGNTGELTGKFYEGIRSRKPILSIVTGTLPNSELFNLQSKYNYGFCYEEASKSISHKALIDYLEKAYKCKQNRKSVVYEPDASLFCDFEYSNLTQKLMENIQKII